MKKLLNLKPISSLFISLCLLFTINVNAYASINNGQASSYSVPNIPYNYLSISTLANTSMSTRENQIYNKIYSSMLNLSNSIMLNTFSSIPDSSEVFSILDKVIDDHPEIFYFSYSGTTYSSSGNLILSYIDTKEKLLPIINAFNSKVDEIILKNISEDMTILEKELTIHDYIVLNTAYDKYNLDNNSLPPESYTAYGILMKNTGVCQGYAYAFKLLLKKVGIESIVISSYNMNHAWNIVTIDGERYHVDVTWDDPLPDRENTTRYTYFNVSDETMQDINHKHNWITSDYLPCISKKYEYLANMDYVSKVGQTLYYTDSYNYSLNKINMDGTNKTTIIPTSAIYPLYYNNWIYYSNFTKGARIFRVRPDGSNNEPLNVTASIDLYIENGKIYYTDYNTNVRSFIDIPEYNIYDLNSDNSVDIVDLAILSSKYNKLKPSPYYEASNDLNLDGIIDIYDLVKISKEIQ